MTMRHHPAWTTLAALAVLGLVLWAVGLALVWGALAPLRALAEALGVCP